MHLDGTAIGSFISAQMLGAMLSNLLWSKLSQRGLNKLIIQICTACLVLVFISVAYIQSIFFYSAIFFFVGACMDGYRLSFTNLLLIIAPEDKRPVYVALQANIGSIGIFFSVLGGFILKASSYEFLYAITAAILSLNFLLVFKLKDER
jgi:predicted MFS family arabinose efflux permease